MKSAFCKETRTCKPLRDFRIVAENMAKSEYRAQKMFVVTGTILKKKNVVKYRFLPVSTHAF